MSGKRKHETLDAVLARPWCYYCDRDFDDQKVLVDHQKAKHFHCQVGNCNRRLGTAGGLKVHMQQVHKEELLEVPGAMEGRRDPSLEIFAELGVPESLKEARTAAVVQYYQKMQRDHRLATGNPLPGEVPPEEASKPKRRKLADEKDDLLARVRARKAQREAEKAALAAGLPPPSATATPPASVTPANGAAAAIAAPDAIPPPSFPTPVSPFPAYPVPGVPSAISPIPQPSAFANGAHGAYAHPSSSSPVHFPPQPSPFVNNYTPPSVPMHNGVNNGYLSNSPYGGGQRSQHSLPVLPTAPLSRPPGLPQHPGRSMGHALPTPPTLSDVKPSNVSEDEPMSRATAAAKAEEFLSSFAAAQNQQGPPSPVPATAAVGAAPPQSSTSQPTANSKQKSSSKSGEQMKLSDRIVSWEEKRARAARYAGIAKSLTTVGAANDNATGPVESQTAS